MKRKSLLASIISIFAALVITACGGSNSDSPKTYTISFDTNGGLFKDNTSVLTVSWSTESHGGYIPGMACYSPVDFDPNCGKLPLRSGYFFTEWNSAPDGSGDTYAGLPHANITYYAQWGSETEGYIISFDSNGGTPVSDKIIAYSGTSVPLPSPSQVTKDGYDLIGWGFHMDNQLSASTYKVTHYVVRNIVLSAIWKSKNATGGMCTANFINIDDLDILLSLHIPCGSPVALPTTTKDGVDIPGWRMGGFYRLTCPDSVYVFEDVDFYTGLNWGMAD